MRHREPIQVTPDDIGEIIEAECDCRVWTLAVDPTMVNIKCPLCHEPIRWWEAMNGDSE